MSMKKSLVIIAITLILALVIPSKGVFAANKKVNSVDVVQANGTMTVSGDVEEGMLAVAVQVLDSDGNLVTLRTGAVDSDNKYKVEIAIAEGDYTVKVADYDGGEIYKDEQTDETQGTEGTDETTGDNEETGSGTEEAEVPAKTEENNPKTGDNIMRAVVVLAVAVLGVLITIIFNRKNKVITRKH